MISVTDREDEGISFTYGTGGRGGRFGGVGKGGLAILTGYAANGELYTVTRKCRNRRAGVRLMRRWLEGTYHG